MGVGGGDACYVTEQEEVVQEGVNKSFPPLGHLFRLLCSLVLPLNAVGTSTLGGSGVEGVGPSTSSGREVHRYVGDKYFGCPDGLWFCCTVPAQGKGRLQVVPSPPLSCDIPWVH